MGYSMIIYGVTSPKKGYKCLKELVSWKNHYLLNMYITIKWNGGNSTEEVIIPFEYDMIDILKEDCTEAIDFLKNHVTEYRLHISENESLVDEWEYKWDAEIPDNPFFKHDFRFFLGRYGIEGFVNYLKVILDFINEYTQVYDVFMYRVL